MLKVLYAGSPEPSAEVLRRLVDTAAGSEEVPYKIVGVLTNPPSAHGRHKTLVPTPVALAAALYDIPVFAPQHLDLSCREEVACLGADIMVCFAYGHIFGPKFLSLFPLGGVNLHPSLLPRYRGPTPVPAAILNGDKESAAAIQRITLAMDEGNILAQQRIPLDGTETAGKLLEACAAAGAKLLCQVLTEASRCKGLPDGEPQTGEASYTKIITKEDAVIDWSMSAVKIDALIRAYTPAPGAWTLYKGEVLKILEAHAVYSPTLPLQEGAALPVPSLVRNTSLPVPSLREPRSGSKQSHIAGDCFISSQAEGNRNDASNAEISMADTAKTPGTVLCLKRREGIMVQTGDGVLAITRLQRQGKKALDDESFVNGEKAFIGSVLGE